MDGIAQEVVVLTQPILDEAEVHRMIALEPIPRNRALLTLLYAAGLRVSEICLLKWRDCQQRNQGGQVTVFGKGNKTRVILMPLTVWMLILSLISRGCAVPPSVPSHEAESHRRMPLQFQNQDNHLSALDTTSHPSKSLL